MFNFSLWNPVDKKNLVKPNEQEQHRPNCSSIHRLLKLINYVPFQKWKLNKSNSTESNFHSQMTKNKKQAIVWVRTAVKT